MIYEIIAWVLVLVMLGVAIHARVKHGPISHSEFWRWPR